MLFADLLISHLTLWPHKLICFNLYKFIKKFPLQNLRDGFKPNIKKMQNLAKPQTLHVSESGVGLLRESSEYEMGNLRRDDSFNM